jgi:hypothetical protein
MTRGMIRGVMSSINTTPMYSNPRFRAQRSTFTVAIKTQPYFEKVRHIDALTSPIQETNLEYELDKLLDLCRTVQASDPRDKFTA